MQSQIRQKPIFIPIINHLWTPNNYSINIVKKWFDELYGPSQVYLLDTWRYSKEQFVTEIKKATSQSETICFYICLHGKQLQNQKTGKPEEFLKLNENVLIPDKELSEMITEIKFKSLYMMIECCHGGGLINFIKIDDKTKDMSETNILIFNICSKEQKCYVLTDHSTMSVGSATSLMARNRINALRNPRIGLQLLKKFYGYLETKVTIVNTIS